MEEEPEFSKVGATLLYGLAWQQENCTGAVRFAPAAELWVGL